MEVQDDRDLWAEVVAAERQVVSARAEFYQHAGTRRDTLRAALEGSQWDRKAALSLLESLPEDVPALLDQLVENAMSPQWALAARRAIASGPHDLVAPALRVIAERRLAGADADDYRRLAELLRHLGDKDALGELLRRASLSGDGDVRDVGRDFESTL
jgi:hypothetical protein